jgi:hypothetical protein
LSGKLRYSPKPAYLVERPLQFLGNMLNGQPALLAEPPQFSRELTLPDWRMRAIAARTTAMAAAMTVIKTERVPT